MDTETDSHEEGKLDVLTRCIFFYQNLNTGIRPLPASVLFWTLPGVSQWKYLLWVSPKGATTHWLTDAFIATTE